MNFQEIANSADQRIIFVHVATNTVVSYPAFLTEYSDTYSVGWGEERVYGRMDAIKPYVGTTRNVSIAFDVVSDSIENARENFLKYSVLTQMLYPVYGEPLKEGGTRGRTLKAPPLLRVKFVNLVSNSAPRSDDLGLLGCISGLTFNPNRDMGFFVESNGDLLPKVFNISFKFDPQHEHTLGWKTEAESDDAAATFLAAKFPYGRPGTDKFRGLAAEGMNDVQAAREATALKGTGD